MAKVPLSILDLAFVGEGEAIADSFAGCVALARLAEESGYQRVWYAEHHNIPAIASSATAVLIAHVAAHTTTIRLGKRGKGRLRSGSNSPSAASRATVWRKASSRAPTPSGSIRRTVSWYSPRGG